MLVLHDVGQLMDQGDAQRRRHLGAADCDAFRVGVVVRERALVLERAHRSDEVDVTVDEAEGPHLALDLFELRDVLVGELVPVGHAVAVLLLGQEVDRDRVVVEQAALVLHEIDEVRHTRVPVRWWRCTVVLRDGPDDRDRRDHEDAANGSRDPPVAHSVRRAGPRRRRRRGRRGRCIRVTGAGSPTGGANAPSSLSPRSGPTPVLIGTH